MDDGSFRICPFCKEKIRASAIKCRYCGEWLEAPAEAVVPEQSQAHVDTEATSVLPAESTLQVTLPSKKTPGEVPPELVPPPVSAIQAEMEARKNTDMPLPQSPAPAGDEKHMPPDMREKPERRSSVTDYVEHELEKRGRRHPNDSSEVTQSAPDGVSSQPSTSSQCLSDEPASRKPGGRYRYFCFLSIGIIGTCIGRSFELHNPDAYTAGGIVGYFLGVLLVYCLVLGIIALIVAALCSSVRRYWFSTVAWLFLLAGLFDITVKGYSEFVLYPQVHTLLDDLQKREAKQMVSGLQDQWSKFVESSTESQGLPERTDTPINITPKAGGEFGEMERLVQDFMNQLALQRKRYLFELKAIGWNGILDANHIEVDATFAEARATIQKAREVVTRYAEHTNMLLGDTRGKIRSLNVNETTKGEMLSGFDQGMERARQNIDTMWSLEGKAINENENIIDLLSDRKGAWVVDGGHVLFDNDTDLKRFNSYIVSIQNIINQQEEIQQQSIQKVDDNFDRLKDATE